MAGEVTLLLDEVRKGNRQALAELMPVVYDELRRLAANYMGRERRGHTLQPTDLVHEAYLRLVGQESQRWENRAHFFAAAAQVMRRLLVDYARAHAAAKRGAGRRLSLDEALTIPMHTLPTASCGGSIE